MIGVEPIARVNSLGVSRLGTSFWLLIWHLQSVRCYAHSPLIFLEFLQAARNYSFKGTFEERTPSRRDPMAWTTAIVFEILFERSARLGQLLPGQTVIVSTTIWDIVGHIGRDLEKSGF